MKQPEDDVSLCGKEGAWRILAADCSSDGADGMLFESKFAVVEKRNGTNPARSFALTTLCPPASLELVSAWKKMGVCLANKVGNEDKEGPLNGD